MAEEVSFGVRRLRQAITNQATCGSGQFELSIDSADKLCRECEDEFARLSWAQGVPAPVDADGEVVPLDTEELYTDGGEMVRVDSICNGGRLWHVKRMHSDKTYWLDSLHLHCLDSWERLEKDVKKPTCEYFDHKGKPCLGCPAKEHPDCIDKRAKDTIRRAKALAERDVKGADRD